MIRFVVNRIFNITEIYPSKITGDAVPCFVPTFTYLYYVIHKKWSSVTRLTMTLSTLINLNENSYLNDERSVCWQLQWLSLLDKQVFGLFRLNVGPSWSWSYGSWIYNYLCNQCLSPLTLWVRILLRRGVIDTTLRDKVCQCLATGQCFSPGTPISSTNKTDHHEITEILLKVALNNIILTKAKLVKLAHVSYTGTVFKVRFTHESSLLRVLFTQVTL